MRSPFIRITGSWALFSILTAISLLALAYRAEQITAHYILAEVLAIFISLSSYAFQWIDWLTPFWPDFISREESIFITANCLVFTPAFSSLLSAVASSFVERGEEDEVMLGTALFSAAMCVVCFPIFVKVSGPIHPSESLIYIMRVFWSFFIIIIVGGLYAGLFNLAFFTVKSTVRVLIGCGKILVMYTKNFLGCVLIVYGLTTAGLIEFVS